MDYNDGQVLISLVILAANNEKTTMNLERAIKLYKWAYDFMKKNKIQENSPLALYCLYNMYFIAQIFEDKKLCDYSITEIEKYELGLNNKQTYYELSSYYEEKGNNKKAEFYLNLAKK